MLPWLDVLSVWHGDCMCACAATEENVRFDVRLLLQTVVFQMTLLRVHYLPPGL